MRRLGLWIAGVMCWALVGPAVGQTVTVVGAGTDMVNGVYTKQSSDADGRPAFRKMGFRIEWQAATGRWRLYRGGSVFYFSTTNTQLPPQLDWQTGPAGDGNPPVLSGDGTLPVELVSFDVVLDGTTAVLRWATASELNNAGFEIQHRAASAGAAGTFAPVAVVAGHGTTDTRQHYRHRIPDLAPGTHAFRLKQIDYDGAFELTAAVQVTVAPKGHAFLSAASPNPFNPTTSLALTTAQAQTVRVAVYDLLGREVARLYAGPMGANETQRFVFDAGRLPSGTYLVRALGEHFLETQRILLMK